MGRPTTPVREVRVTGPLAPFAADLVSALRDSGYTPLSAAAQLRLMAHLSRWLAEGGLGVADLTGERVDAYLRARRAGHTQLCSRRALRPLLEVLATRGALPADPPVEPASPTDVVLASFGRHLLSERGLDASTTAAYVARAGRFLAGLAPERDLGTLGARDVTAAVLAESATRSVGAAQYLVAALRSLLRSCHPEGPLDADLSAAALPVTGRRTSSLPRAIGPADARALLGSCDRRRAGGRRDHAVLLTLLRLGLRATEVTVLALTDIDWRAGEVTVHGKGRRVDRLPLPVEVGEAIAGYLGRGRPGTRRREVLLSAVAPVAPLSRGGISSIVRRACRRAGIPPVGAHRLRHALACAMVRSGVPLPAIGEVLRHRDLASTAVYARVDLDGLRSLARRWPGSERWASSPATSATTSPCAGRWASGSSGRAGSCRSSSPIPRPPAPRPSRRSWPSRGRGCRRACSPSAGRTGSARRAASPATSRTIDPATEVPPRDVFGARQRRPAPYLWTDGDVRRLMEAARDLRPPLRAATHEAPLGLLAATGMRLGEAVGLERDDVDLAEGLLTVRRTKSRRPRVLPLHESATAALRAYAEHRDRLCPRPRSRAFLVSSVGTTLGTGGVEGTLARLATTLGLRTASVRPTLHGLRHTFAVATLIAWQRSGEGVGARMASLSTYLGHIDPGGTYWYLSATPELMGLAAERLEGRLGGRP